MAKPKTETTTTFLDSWSGVLDEISNREKIHAEEEYKILKSETSRLALKLRSTGNSDLIDLYVQTLGRTYNTMQIKKITDLYVTASRLMRNEILSRMTKGV